MMRNHLLLKEFNLKFKYDMQLSSELIIGCTLLLMFYKSSEKKIVNIYVLSRMQVKDIYKELPFEVNVVLDEYNFKRNIKKIDTQTLQDIYDFCNEHILNETSSFFGILKILLIDFDWLNTKIEQDKIDKCISALNLLNLRQFKELLLFSDKFNNTTISELLTLLLYIGNFDKIHIICFDNTLFDYDVSVNKIIKALLQDLEMTESELREIVTTNIIEINHPHMNFDFLDNFILNNCENQFIMVIGINRFISYKKTSDITVNIMDSQLQLHHSENIDWVNFVNHLDKLFSYVNGKSSWLTVVYNDENLIDRAVEIVTELSFDLKTFDIAADHFTYTDSDRNILYNKLFEQIELNNECDFLNLIEKNKSSISDEHIVKLNSYFHLANNDYINAIYALETLPDDSNLANKFLLGTLYNRTGCTDKAFSLYQDIYSKDKFYPNLINEIILSLEHCGDEIKLFEWIEKGLELNPDDILVLTHLGNYYSRNAMYLKAAKTWAKLYELTYEPFNNLLREINILLSDIKNTSMEIIKLWLDEKIVQYAQFKDEIYYRIGLIIYDEKRKDDSLPFFEKVISKFDNSITYNTSLKIVELHHRKCFRFTKKEISDQEALGFIEVLINNIVTLTYGSKTVYIWSKYIENTYSYSTWKKYLNELLFKYLCIWEEKVFDDDHNKTILNINENSELESKFEIIGKMYMPNLESCSLDERLLLMLVQAQTEASKGNLQMSNDVAFTFFKLSHDLNNEYKNVAISFGLLSWSNTCFKIGAVVEGILSFIAAMNQGININEYYLAMKFYMINIFEYLYDSSNDLFLNSEQKKLLERYFTLLDYPKSLFFSITKEYDKVLEVESKEITNFINLKKKFNTQLIINFKDNDFNYILHIDNLINSYFMSGNIKNAIFYIDTFYSTLLLNLSEHQDVLHKFVIRWAEIYAMDSNFDKSIELLSQAVDAIEKLRRVSHKSERSFLGSELDKTYRKILLLLCRKNGSKKDFVLNLSCVNAIINLIPKSIIEQKYQNYTVFLNDDLIVKEKRYNQLFNIIENMNNKTLSNPNYKEKVEEFLFLKDILEKNHPNYKPLPTYCLINNTENNSFLSISAKLEEGEIFYRNVLVGEFILHVTVTNHMQQVVTEKIDLSMLSILQKKLDNFINASIYELEKEVETEYTDLFEEISCTLFKPLIEQLVDFSTLYYMPDLTLTHITPNFLRTKGKWIIETLNNIELVIDYNDIGKTKFNTSQETECNYFVSDSSIGLLPSIKKTLSSIGYFKEVLPRSGNIIVDKQLKTFVLAAHGISNQFGEEYYGAKNISLSKKKQVDLSEFINIYSNIDNMIVLACSGGTPTEDRIECDNGVWASLFNKDIKFILYCKWDVSTKHTNLMLSEILGFMNNSDVLLSEALIKAQRNFTSINPVLWAGLEVWKNQ
ncbi:tetratricopeptide repeat protein [Anaeromicropila herbilytica]|uniref:CHAT domain-containing protein n=1 Tax=Anaeromicropila herbilytica TaxID=2785025 RepID=A0A7R7ICQ6_9FIRM|nr:hypothetical protein [Anaeromicropila herbilytica]BCN30126.1 hypothetical protein bsdtb5_14210 [Anaeromicropila herbilytica]